MVSCFVDADEEDFLSGMFVISTSLPGLTVLFRMARR